MTALVTWRYIRIHLLDLAENLVNRCADLLGLRIAHPRVPILRYLARLYDQSTALRGKAGREEEEIVRQREVLEPSFYSPQTLRDMWVHVSHISRLFCLTLRGMSQLES